MNALRPPVWLWQPETVDSVAAIGLAGVLLVFLVWLVFEQISAPEIRARYRVFAVSIVGLILSFVGGWVGYASFRTANMMSALQYISDQGNEVGNMETDNPSVLCLYRWGEQGSELNPRRGCGSDIFVTPDGSELSDQFDDLMLYIEEVILFASESNIYKNRYGSDFYRGLSYWITDFSEDPTGAISYYIAQRELKWASDKGLKSIDVASVACLRRLTGIAIPQLCEKRRAFLSSLNDAGRHSESNVECSLPDPTYWERDLTRAAARNKTSIADYCAKQSYWGESFQGGKPS